MITVADLQGHWRRDWITAPGFEDRTTRVHWLQAGALFADIRVPLARPAVTGASCLADLSDSALAQVMTAEGFAGDITVADNACTWRRAINWHGVPQADDIGLMSWAGDGALIEDGVLARYRERWLQEPTGALTGYRVTCDTLSGVLIADDATFLIALGQVPQGTSEPLQEALRTGQRDAPALRAHFASTYALGTWQDNSGIVTLSTNPFCEGRPVLLRGPEWVWLAPDFDGRQELRPLSLSAPRGI